MKMLKITWPIIRILLFLVLGLMNTLWIRPEDVGSWKNYLGYVLLALAIYDIAWLLIKRQRRS